MSRGFMTQYFLQKTTVPRSNLCLVSIVMKDKDKKKDFTRQLKPEESVVLSVDCSPALVLNWLVWRRDNFTSGLIFPRSPPTVLVCTSAGWLMAAADNFKTSLWMFVCFCIIIMSINAVKVLKTSEDEECFECLQLLSRIMSLLSTTFYRFIISGALIKIDMAVD